MRIKVKVRRSLHASRDSLQWSRFAPYVRTHSLHDYRSPQQYLFLKRGEWLTRLKFSILAHFQRIYLLARRQISKARVARRTERKQRQQLAPCTRGTRNPRIGQFVSVCGRRGKPGSRPCELTQLKVLCMEMIIAIQCQWDACDYRHVIQFSRHFMT